MAIGDAASRPFKQPERPGPHSKQTRFPPSPAELAALQVGLVRHQAWAMELGDILIADSIGIKVDRLPTGEIGLDGIRAIWWFGLASALVGALIAITMVRVPKAVEKEHVQ